MTVEIVDLRTGEIEARSSPRRVKFPDRLATINLVMPIVELPVEHEGRMI